MKAGIIYSTLACQENGCVWISVNLTTGYERITKYTNASNLTCYLETFKTLTKWAGYIIASAKNLHFFITRGILKLCDHENQWKVSWGSANRNWY